MVVRHFWPDKLTALPRAVYEVSKRLVETGQEVVIITNKEGSNDSNQRKIVLKEGLIVKFTDHFYHSITNENFDILHFYGSLLGSFFLLRAVDLNNIILSLYTSKHTGKDLMTLKLVDLIYDKRSRFMLNPILGTILPDPLLRRELRKAKRIIVQSYRFKQFLCHLLDSSKVVQIPHGVELKRYSNSSRKWEELKKELGFSKSDRVVLYFGHAFLMRGIDDLLSAMKLVHRELPDSKLLLVFSKIPGFSINYIRKLMDKYQVSNFSKMIINYVPNPEDYYKLADLLALPYRCCVELPEYPFVLLEAMASGKPIITTDIGALPEIIKDKNNGLLVSRKNVKELAHTITVILTNRELAHKLGKNARKDVEVFNWDTVTNEIFKIYKRVLDEK